jgi:hypothetical protein
MIYFCRKKSFVPGVVRTEAYTLLEETILVALTATNFL